MKISRADMIFRLGAITLALLAAALLLPELTIAADPASGAISPAISPGAPTVTWTGGPFLISNPTSCGLAEPTCDHFTLTINPPRKDFVVTVRIVARSLTDDLDLSERPQGPGASRLVRPGPLRRGGRRQHV